MMLRGGSGSGSTGSRGTGAVSPRPPRGLHFPSAPAPRCRAKPPAGAAVPAGSRSPSVPRAEPAPPPRSRRRSRCRGLSARGRRRRLLPGVPAEAAPAVSGEEEAAELPTAARRAASERRMGGAWPAGPCGQWWKRPAPAPRFSACVRREMPRSRKRQARCPRRKKKLKQDCQALEQLPRELLESPSLEGFQSRVGVALREMGWWVMGLGQRLHSKS
ncbi:proline-rich protein 33-like [Colius striatus]|uniref:proline-rich protein 33-like n=1 Tax=Colius striatus TaxID=57412 RepID=UPI002B1DD1FC|nr:proline-rich protein 33-like [Colius striatus]